MINCKFFLSITIILLLAQNVNSQMSWNQACTFAGSNSSYISIRNSSELDITGSFTIEAWVNPSNAVSPSFQIVLQKRNAGANGYTLYLNDGRVAIRTGGSTRLIGNEVIPSNKWTHITGTYYSPTNTFTTYVDGIFDTTVAIAGSAPLTNTDSVWIGKGANSPFAGAMDEVRIWNRALSPNDVYNFRRISLGSNTGLYTGLVLSMTFQDNDASGIPFTLVDWSTNGNTGINRGVNAYDQRDRPLTTIQMNDCIDLDGSSYLSGPDEANVSPTTQITIAAWVYLRSYTNAVFIHKGSASGGGSTNYRLGISNRVLTGGINGFFITTNDTIPLHKWTYVVMTFVGSNSTFVFYIDGKRAHSELLSVGNVINGTDSIYIGGTSTLTKLNGYIDEVRVLPIAQNVEDINKYMFTSMELSNGVSGSYASYNFDGYTYNNGAGTGPVLKFHGGANFAHCGTSNDQPQSPLNRCDPNNFVEGFYLKKTDRRIPAVGNSGAMITDSLEILNDLSINDINLFVTLNHNQEQDLQISLQSPSGSVIVYFQNTLSTDADHVTTIFDDQADSVLKNGLYVNYSSKIRPTQNMNSVFSGTSSKGVWRLSVTDLTNSASNDTGRLYGWGIQINNTIQKPYFVFNTALIQGFYNPVTNLMARDTMRLYLRELRSPYDMIDSAKVYVTNLGTAPLSFSGATSGDLYYLQLKHRNSIETWNSSLSFNPLTYETSFNMTTSASKAYGNNMIAVDISPAAFAIYGGDINQSGNIDATDLSIVDNDAFNFTTGYVNSDVTGDNVTDASDYAIVDNNAFNFVTSIIPPILVSPNETEKQIEANGISANDPNFSN